jgi:prephenate dehydrogenase
MKIAIVGGSGKMGAWFGNFFAKEGHNVTLIGRNEERLRGLASSLGVNVSTRPEALATAQLILISVPIDSFEQVAANYGKYVAEDQNVVEITSVKQGPIAALHKYLKTNRVIGIHPMFGPGARDFHGHNFILTPTNEVETSLANKVKAYVKERGGKVSVMSPETHDKTMSVVLGLPHLIALASADTLLKLGSFQEMEALGGTTCKLLLMLADSVLSEDAELYASIQTNLQGIGDIYALLEKNLAEWTSLVRSKDKQGFISRMEALSQMRETTGPAFRQAYDDMYNILDI